MYKKKPHYAIRRQKNGDVFTVVNLNVNKYVPSALSSPRLYGKIK